jgi:predicted transglutaminase-like cysteine proteinase
MGFQMNIRTAVGAALIGLLANATTASALDAASKTPGSQSGKYFENEFGKTLPPIGYVQFCATNPDECKITGGKSDKLAMSPERWSLLYQVNAYVNGKIAPISDQDLYGEAERWTYPTDAGDCEDYVLLKKRYLQGLGFSADALLITVVLDENGDGHAVLSVTTDGGDFVLDNRRNDVMRWNETNYKFLKRQSQRDPLQWVALEKNETVSSGSIATRTQH